jgi:two-component system NtrC family sensor kinase
MLKTSELFHRRVLVIDDNPAIHEDFRKIFTPPGRLESEMTAREAALFGGDETPEVGPGCEFDSAFQGQEGLQLVQKARADQRPYAVAFVDVRMPPGWDGIETITHLWRADPDLQVVVCTAYSDYSLDDILEVLGSSDRLVILRKPFDNIEVLQLVNALTEKWRLQQQARARTEELEQRVAARTQELQAANQKLQAEMAERVQVEAAFRQSQKMEAIGQLAGGVAHDFNNILTVIRGYTSMVLGNERLDKRTQDFLQQVDDAAQRASSLTRQLLMFSRKQMLQPEYLDPAEVIGQVSKLLHRVLGEDIALVIQTEKNGPRLHADRAMLEQILLNLAVNARDAMPKGGRLLIGTEAVTLIAAECVADPRRRAGQFVCFTATDSGCGIAPEVLPRIFEPFFTTKDVGKGTGLGLSTVYGIVKHHAGWIEVESAPGQGATFKIFLPSALQPGGPAPAADAAVKARGGTETMLLVEDELSVRNLARKVLQRYGYQVLAAGSGAEALKVWEEHAGKIDLLLTDMVMPGGISGRELAQRLQTDKHELKVIYSSGYSQELINQQALHAEGMHFLPKPYSPEQLARVVRNCLDGAPENSPRTINPSVP